LCDNHDQLLSTCEKKCPYCGSHRIEQAGFGSLRQPAPANDVAALHRNQDICLCEVCGKTFYLVELSGT
jgi:hypothetical protein